MNNKKDTIRYIVEKNKSVDFDQILNQLSEYPIYIENKRELADILSELEADKAILYFSNQYWATQGLQTKKGWITPGAKAGVFFTTEKPNLELGANYTLNEDTAYSLITKRGAIPNQEVECYMVPVGPEPASLETHSSNSLTPEALPRYAAYTKRIIQTHEFEFVGVLEADKIKAFIKGFELELGRHVLSPEDAADYQVGDWGHFLYTPAQGQESARLELLEHITQRNRSGFESEIGAYLVAEAIKSQKEAHHNFERELALEPQVLDTQKLVYQDLKGEAFMTIDSLSTRDIDDAVCIKTEADSQTPTQINTRLLVAIADVSAEITPGSTADKEAFIKTSSFYFPHKTQHMLDAQQAEKDFSLNPAVEKKVMVADMLFSPKGELLSENFYPALIVSKARLTYEDVDRMFLGEQMTQSRVVIGGVLRDFAKTTALENTNFHKSAEYQALCAQLRAALELREKVAQHKEHKKENAAQQVAQKLNRDDMYRPAKVEWVLDEKGEVSELVLEKEAGPAQKIVEFSMVSANVSAAQFMFDKYPTTALFRNQAQTPEGEKTKPAAYSSNVSGHSGLETDFYTHFTSPIRRYCDLVVHRILKETLLEERSLTESWLESIASHINAVAVRSRAIDTKISQLVMNRYIEKLYKSGRNMFETKLVDFFEHGAVFRSPEHIEFFVPAFKVDPILGEKIYNFMQSCPEKTVEKTKAFLHEVNALSYPIELIDIDPVLDKKMAGPKREPRFQRGTPRR